MDPASQDIVAMFSDESIWIRIGMVAISVFIAITALKQTIAALPQTGPSATALNKRGVKPIMVLLPYILGIGIAFIPGVIPGHVPPGITILFGAISGHFSEKVYKSFAGAMPNFVLSSLSQKRVAQPAPAPVRPPQPMAADEAAEPGLEPPQGSTGGGDASSLGG